MLEYFLARHCDLLEFFSDREVAVHSAGTLVGIYLHRDMITNKTTGRTDYIKNSKDKIIKYLDAAFLFSCVKMSEYNFNIYIHM